MKLDKTFIFEYYKGGNIISKRTAEYTCKAEEEIPFTEEIFYAYDGDKLISSNGSEETSNGSEETSNGSEETSNGGEEISNGGEETSNDGEETSNGGEEIAYDNGNPTRYRGNALTWQNGKQLIGFGNTTFSYDGYGRRIKKNHTVFTYDSNNRLVKQSDGANTLEFIYDESGLSGARHNETDYIYRKNAQGDITHIYNTAGMVVAKYAYDAWGNHKVLNPDETENTNSTFIGNINAIRYRRYYYDVETQLFYCNSRYYSPELCRWISPDSIEYLDPESINGLNLYCYCYNNPIMYSDPSGQFAISTLIISAIIGTVIGGATSAITQGLTKGWDNINGWQVLLDATIGGISGALGASGINKIISIIAGGVLGAAGSVAGDIIAVKGDFSQLDVWKVVGKAAIMGGFGALLGKWTGAGTQNSKVMVDTINVGKSWGSKAFLTSAKEALLRPNSGLTLQTMYMNMSKAISLYTVEGITKVSAAILGSTFLGNFIGW